MPTRTSDKCLRLLVLLLMVAPIASPQIFQSPLIVAPHSMDFGRVVSGTESDAETIMVFNNGTSPEELGGIVISGAFTQTNSCPKPPATLAPSEDCEIQVRFKPAGLGTQSGTLVVSQAVGDIKLTVALSGTSIAERPKVALSPGALSFPELQAGMISSARTVTVTNTGSENVFISDVVASGDFNILPTSTCTHMTDPLGPKQSCIVEIVFAPRIVGTRVGVAFVSDDAEGSPQRVTLTGTGK